MTDARIDHARQVLGYTRESRDPPEMDVVCLRSALMQVLEVHDEGPDGNASAPDREVLDREYAPENRPVEPNSAGEDPEMWAEVAQWESQRADAYRESLTATHHERDEALKELADAAEALLGLTRGVVPVSTQEVQRDKLERVETAIARVRGVYAGA
ncbi:MAG: hypothetical protein WD492_12780 [Alkalispirochaeta sp.]